MVLSGRTLGFFNLTPLAMGDVTPVRHRPFLRASDFNPAPRNARNPAMKVEMEAAWENAFQLHPAVGED